MVEGERKGVLKRRAGVHARPPLALIINGHAVFTG